MQLTFGVSSAGVVWIQAQLKSCESLSFYNNKALEEGHPKWYINLMAGIKIGGKLCSNAESDQSRSQLLRFLSSSVSSSGLQCLGCRLCKSLTTPKQKRSRPPWRAKASLSESAICSNGKKEGVDVSFPKAPSVLIIPTLGPKVFRYDRLWAIWSLRDCVLDEKLKFGKGPQNFPHGVADQVSEPEASACGGKQSTIISASSSLLWFKKTTKKAKNKNEQ